MSARSSEVDMNAVQSRLVSSLRVRLLAWALCVLAGGVLVRVFGCVESLAYWPVRGETTPHLPVEEVWFEAEDGVRLHGWWLEPLGYEPGDRVPAVLHVHGNAGKLGDHVDNAAFLRRSGMGVLVFDYAGYGASESRGSIRRGDVLKDTRAALRYLRQRLDVDGERVGVYGFSLGGCFALAAVAEDVGVRSVATLSTFSTWKGAASDFVPLVGGWLMPSGLEPVDSVRGVGERQYLILHGTADGIVRHRHSVILRDAALEAGVDVRYMSFEGADHNSILLTHVAARDAITSFFVETLGVDGEVGAEPAESE